MPCFDDRDYYSAHNNEAASLLCAVMRRVEAGDAVVTLTPELRRWWEEHKARDASRA